MLLYAKTEPQSRVRSSEPLTFHPTALAGRAMRGSGLPPLLEEKMFTRTTGWQLAFADEIEQEAQ
jgi:hypothetical protein